MDTRKIEDVPFEEVHEIQRYGTYFSEKSFWKKIERVAKKVGATVLRPVFTLYYMLQDEKVPLQHKAYIIGALGYFILPFDLIPESVLPIIGFTDDVAVMTFVLKCRCLALRQTYAAPYPVAYASLSISATTPGSSLPSSRRMEAPPPVEMNVT